MYMDRVILDFIPNVFISSAFEHDRYCEGSDLLPNYFSNKGLIARVMHEWVVGQQQPRIRVEFMLESTLPTCVIKKAVLPLMPEPYRLRMPNSGMESVRMADENEPSGKRTLVWCTDLGCPFCRRLR